MASPSERVPITPAVLAWAIAESGYQPVDVAVKLGISEDVLRAWLAGAEQPRLTYLKKLAQVLRRPKAIFLLPEPPDSTRPQVEFRYPPDSEREALNPDELRYLREAARVQRVAAWALAELDEPLLSLPAMNVDVSPENAGREIRTLLGVTVEEQLAWESPSKALQAWRAMLQNLGVLVFQLPLGRNACRGFSLWEERAPLISINTAWNTEARIFTLFHELAHLLTRTDSACIEATVYHRDATDPAERWCERFAAAVLMPWAAIANLLRRECHWTPGKHLADLNAVKLTARRFKTSLRATLLRMIEHDAASWEMFNELPTTADAKRPGGGGQGRSRAQIMLDRYGTRTTHVLVKAMDEDILTRMDVLTYLDIPDDDLDDLRRGPG